MEFEQSALQLQVNQIFAAGSLPVHYTVSATVLVTSTGYTVTPLKVMSVDNKRDYLDAYADQMIVEMHIPMGVYATYIYPNKNATDVTLTLTPLLEVGDSVDPNGVVLSETFTATLIDTGSPVMEQQTGNAISQENLDLAGYATVHFQLVNKALEQMRMIDVGQVFRSATVDDAIKTILTLASQTTTVNGVRTVQGVTMVKSSNPTVRDHILIPHGVKLVDFPQYMQKNCGGVYNAGMGYYLQGNQWYVYPALDTTRFASSTSKLTVINVPSNRFPDIERTYSLSGGSLIVLATGKVSFRDPSNKHQLNFGNGIRFADATKFMGNFVTVADNKALASRGANNSEFIATQRPNGNNKVHLSPNPINANSLEETSQLARAMGSTIEMEWQNSNPDLIKPGMPAEVLYLVSDQIQTITGVVTGAHHYQRLREKGLNATRYITSSILSIFVEPQDITAAANSTP